MIPKKIHYCWFGRNPKPDLAQKCIRSWKRYCSDYEIIEWNEDNYDISAVPLYVRQAYEAKKWAFVTDYVRLDVVYRYGGIYLDTDVEVIKSLDRFLKHRAFFGLESPEYINTGLGFGAERGAEILEELMADYQEIPFVLPDGSFDQTSCPVRNTQVFLKRGFLQKDEEQVVRNEMHIYPCEFFSPMSCETGIMTITPNTYSIHHFAASWVDPQKQREKKRRWKNYRRHRQVEKILGEQWFTLLRKLVRIVFPDDMPF